MADTDRQKPGRRREHPEGLTATVSIALPPSEQKRLERLANARGVSLSKLLRERLVSHR